MMKWYTTKDKKGHAEQVVLALPKGDIQSPKFGTMFFTEKYSNLVYGTWCAGYFRTDDDKGPFLMARVDNNVQHFINSELRIAFSFYKFPSGGLFGIFVGADSEELKTTSPNGLNVVEGIFGLDDSEVVNLIKDALERDLVHICFAGAGFKHVAYDEKDNRIEMRGPACQFDRIVNIPENCRKILIKEFKKLIAYHSSLSAKNYRKSLEQLTSEFPPDKNPIINEKGKLTDNHELSNNTTIPNDFEIKTINSVKPFSLGLFDMTSAFEQGAKPEAETMPQPETASESEAEAVPQPETVQPAAEAMLQPETASEPEAESIPQHETVTGPEAETLAQAETAPKPEDEAVPQPETVPEPEAEAIRQPETISEPEAETLAQAETVPEPEAEAIRQPETISEPDVETLAQPETISEPEAETLAQPETVPNPEAETLAQPETISEPEGETLAQPETVPEPEAGPIPNSETVPESIVQPVPESEPGFISKTEDMPVPQVEIEPLSENVTEPEAGPIPNSETVPEPLPESIVQPEPLPESDPGFISKTEDMPVPEVESIPHSENATEPEAGPIPNSETVPEPLPESIVQPEPLPESDPGFISKTEDIPVPEVESIPYSENVSEAGLIPNSETAPEPLPESIVQPEPLPEPVVESITQPETLDEAEAEFIQEQATVPKPEAEYIFHLEPEPEIVPYSETEPESEVETLGQQETTIKPKVNTVPQPGTIIEPEPELMHEAETVPEPVVESAPRSESVYEFEVESHLQQDAGLKNRYKPKLVIALSAFIILIFVSLFIILKRKTIAHPTSGAKTITHQFTSKNKLSNPDSIIFGKAVNEYDKGQLSEAFELFVQSAMSYNNPNSQYMLGYMYHKGLGIKKNELLALKWFKKSADQNYEGAKFFLGLLYFSGENEIPPNIELSKQYLEWEVKNGKNAGYIKISQHRLDLINQ